MTEHSQELRTYRVGEKIRIVLNLHDESGVSLVEALFAENSDTSKQYTLYGDGEGQVDADVVLEEEVPPGTPPGEYQCFQLTLFDTLNNRTNLINPRPVIGFRIEESPGDYGGPEYKGWRYG